MFSVSLLFNAYHPNSSCLHLCRKGAHTITNKLKQAVICFIHSLKLTKKRKVFPTTICLCQLLLTTTTLTQHTLLAVICFLTLLQLNHSLKFFIAFFVVLCFDYILINTDRPCYFHTLAFFQGKKFVRGKKQCSEAALTYSFSCLDSISVGEIFLPSTLCCDYYKSISFVLCVYKC